MGERERERTRDRMAETDREKEREREAVLEKNTWHMWLGTRLCGRTGAIKTFFRNHRTKIYSNLFMKLAFSQTTFWITLYSEKLLVHTGEISENLLDYKIPFKNNILSAQMKYIKSLKCYGFPERKVAHLELILLVYIIATDIAQYS